MTEFDFHETTQTIAKAIKCLEPLERHISKAVRQRASGAKRLLTDAEDLVYEAADLLEEKANK